MIPNYHDLVELVGTKYFLVLQTNYGVTNGEGHKFSYNSDTNYQKNGRVYSKNTDAAHAAKIESRKLKSSKRKKSYEKRIISDLKYDKRMFVLYGLA